MNVIKDRFDPDIEKKLSVLGSVPRRDPESAASGRKKFLTEARALTPPVLKGDESRNWIGVLLAAFGGNKRSPALAALASFALVLVILLGGTSATVYAAQGSMPDQVLYSVKLLSEDLRLGLTSSPQAELELTLDLVDRRLEEIDFLVDAGEEVPDSVVDRMEVHLDLALNIAVAIDDEMTLSEIDPAASGRGPVQDRDQDQGRTKILVEPTCGTDKSDAGCKEESEGEPSEQPVNAGTGEGGPGEGSDDPIGPCCDPSDIYCNPDPDCDPYDPYQHPDHEGDPPYGQPPADPPNNGSGPQPDEPPASAWGPGPGQCIVVDPDNPFRCTYQPDDPYGPPPDSPPMYGPGEGSQPIPAPSSGDGGDSGSDSGDSGSDSGDSGSGSSGEDSKAP